MRGDGFGLELGHGDFAQVDDETVRGDVLLALGCVVVEIDSFRSFRR